MKNTKERPKKKKKLVKQQGQEVLRTREGTIDYTRLEKC